MLVGTPLIFICWPQRVTIELSGFGDLTWSDDGLAASLIFIMCIGYIPFKCVSCFHFHPLDVFLLPWSTIEIIADV